MATSEILYMAVIDVSAHVGYVREVRGPAWPAEGGWTYQEITGAHGTVLAEDADRHVCQRALDAWLADCPATSGGRCYTHGGAS